MTSLASRLSPLILCFLILNGSPALAADKALELNELEYFETRGLNVLVFSNWYNGLFSDSKISGIELIHHGERTATNGDVRLFATPEQWDLIPAFVDKKINRKQQTIEARLRYADYDFDYSIRAKAKGDSIEISVVLPKKLPQSLVGKAGFNLEFLPASYFEKTFIADTQSGLFPLYPSGVKEQNNNVSPVALASGQHLTLAPADPSKRVSIKSKSGTLSLYDGRNKAQNGWFVVRELLPANKKGEVLRWTLSANTLKDWLRDPVISHSQVGYHPQQKKVAHVELDKNASATQSIQLYRIDASGARQLAHESPATLWGRYKRYNYLRFDFSQVDREGVYQIVYGKHKSASFRIAKDVFKTAWHPTLDVFFPVQMDHVLVNEAYRVWHGASHLDDALQAPTDHVHFDLYAQSSTTDTQYQPGEHIPGLNIGGWYDAGDYDIRTQTQYRTVRHLVSAWELFEPLRDTTLVDYPAKYVDLHVADGKPDLLQQIEHGTLALIAQHRAVGHAIPGIIVPDISQYTHLGDGLTMTDNMIYNSDMAELESNGKESGKFDDRWAFTNHTTALNYGSAAALAAASRALTGYNDELAKECLATAKKVWAFEQQNPPSLYRHGNTTGGPLDIEKLNATLELLVTTGDKKYQQSFSKQLPVLQENFKLAAIIGARALPYMDEDYQASLRKLVLKHKKQLLEQNTQNPFGVDITEGGWAGNGWILFNGLTNYYLHKAFPDIIEKEDVYKSLHYVFGSHPDSAISFVSGVGSVSKTVAYGMNRADYSFIAGGIVPGVLILKPDFPENKENWPFLWGENEYVINLGAVYIALVLAVDELLNEK